MSKFNSTGSSSAEINSLVYDNGTNVGIGTTSPAAKFHIEGAANADMRITSKGTGATNYATMQLYNDAGTSFGFTKASGAGGLYSPGIPRPHMALFANRGSMLFNATGNIGFATLIGSTNYTRLFVDSATGNVGINTTNPTAKLHVVGTSDSVGFFTSNSLNAVTGIVRSEYTGNTISDHVALYGRSVPSQISNYGIGVVGEGGWIGAEGFVVNKTTLATYGVVGTSSSRGDTYGVAGIANNDTSTVEGAKVGLWGYASDGSTNYGVYGFATGGNTNYAGAFDGNTIITGNLTVLGTLAKSSGTFKIDHPQDPENKYLYHSFVESPDMMNVYNGNTISDANGKAIVTLPDYFEVLNKDFRYQLTCIGQPAQVWISQKIQGNTFEISCDKPNVEISWQVTGIRQDKFAQAYPIVPEVEKPEAEKGTYMHPELYEQSDEKGVFYKPSLRKRLIRK
ncbi:MAG: hypothetical protein R2831_10155 [Chitinophagaceae bacterium]